MTTTSTGDDPEPEFTTEYALQRRPADTSVDAWDFEDPFEDPWWRITWEAARDHLRSARRNPNGFTYRLVSRQVSDPAVEVGPDEPV